MAPHTRVYAQQQQEVEHKRDEERTQQPSVLAEAEVTAAQFDMVNTETPGPEPLAERSEGGAAPAEEGAEPLPLFCIEIIRMNEETDRAAKDELRVQMLRSMIKAGLTISLSRVPIFRFGQDLRRGLRRGLNRRMRKQPGSLDRSRSMPTLARAASSMPVNPNDPPIGHRIFVKVTMSPERLEEEADRMQAMYRRRPIALPVAVWFDGAHPRPVPAEGPEKPEAYLENVFQEFSIAEKHDFVDDGEHNGRTRYRMELLDNVLESRGARGCGLRLRELQEREAVSGWFFLHEEESADGQANCQWFIRNWVMGLMWRAPVNQFRDYFGEKVAFYFAFMDSYANALILPALFGGALYTAQKATGVVDLAAVPFYSIFLVVWAVLFLETWKRRQAALAHGWGVTGYRRLERSRPEYLERPGTAATTPDLVSGEPVPVHTFWQRLPRFAVTYCTVILAAALVSAATVSLLVFRLLINSFLPYTVSVVNSVFIIAMDFCYKRLAWKLTDWENHRFETQYEGRLVWKLFAFQFVNNYCSLFYYAFYEGSDPDNCGWRGKGAETCGVDVMGLLGTQLAAILVIRTISSNTIEIYLPVVMSVLKRGSFTGRSIVNAVVRNAALSERTLIDQIDDYMDAIILFGFATFFASAFPASAAIVLVNNLLKLRTDTYKMLRIYERPRPQRAPDIGPWVSILQIMAFTAVLTNSGIVLFTSNQLQNNWGSAEFSRRVVIVGIFEHVVVLLQFLLMHVIPDVPRWVVDEEKLAAAWQRHRLQFREVTRAPPPGEGMGAASARALSTASALSTATAGRSSASLEALAGLSQRPPRKMAPGSRTMRVATEFAPNFDALPHEKAAPQPPTSPTPPPPAPDAAAGNKSRRGSILAFLNRGSGSEPAGTPPPEDGPAAGEAAGTPRANGGSHGAPAGATARRVRIAPPVSAQE